MAERVPSEPSAFTHLLHKINGEELVVRFGGEIRVLNPSLWKEEEMRGKESRLCSSSP